MFCSPQILARSTPKPSGGSGLTLTTFDGASLSNATLSNGNLTATRSNTSIGGAASTSYKSSGKYYFEFTVGASHSSRDFVGIKATTASYDDITNGNGGNYAGLWVVDGREASNGGIFGNLGAASAGDVISCAVDLVNNHVWMRRNGGQWNGTSTADPAGNNGGGGSWGGASVAPVIGFSNAGSPVSGDNFTANFGATSFVYAVPFGFTAGWPP